MSNISITVEKPQDEIVTITLPNKSSVTKSDLPQLQEKHSELQDKLAKIRAQGAGNIQGTSGGGNANGAQNEDEEKIKSLKKEINKLKSESEQKSAEADGKDNEATGMETQGSILIQNGTALLSDGIPENDAIGMAMIKRGENLLSQAAKTRKDATKLRKEAAENKARAEKKEKELQELEEKKQNQSNNGANVGGKAPLPFTPELKAYLERVNKDLEDMIETVGNNPFGKDGDTTSKEIINQENTNKNTAPNAEIHKMYTVNKAMTSPG